MISSKKNDNAESKNAKMNEERSFFAKIAEASLSGNYIEVQTLCEEYALRHSVSVYETITEFRDGRRRTILHFACQSSQDGTKIPAEDIVYQLLLSDWSKEHKILETDMANSQQSLLRCKDADGMTPLMVACQLADRDSQLSYLRVQTLLLAGGNKLALARSKDGATSLHYAAGAGADKAMISQLYDAAKAAISVNSKGGGTPLHWAAGSKTNVVHTLDALITYCGADTGATNESGITPFILALASGNDDNATFLVERSSDADLGVILSGNVTAYHIAADMNLPRALRALLSRNGKKSETCCNMKNDRGEIPLDLAVLSGNIQCVMLLLPKDHMGYNDETEARIYAEERKFELEHKQQGQEKTINRLETENQEPDGKTKGAREKEISAIEDRAKAYANHMYNMVVSAEDKASSLNHKQDGNDLFAKHLFKDAVIEYNKAIEADPTESTFYSNRSACFIALKQYDEALYDAVVCRVLKPDWTKGCFRLTVARLALGRYEDAALSAWEGLQLDNDNEELKNLLQKSVKLGNIEHKKMMAQNKVQEIDDIVNI